MHTSTEEEYVILLVHTNFTAAINYGRKPYSSRNPGCGWWNLIPPSYLFLALSLLARLRKLGTVSLASTKAEPPRRRAAAA